MLTNPDVTSAPSWVQVATVAFLGAALVRLAVAEWARGRVRALWRLASVPGVYFLGLAALGAAQRFIGAEPPAWLWGLLLGITGALWVATTVHVLKSRRDQ